MNEELTVIIPVYNEEESLPAFFEEFDRLISTSEMPLKGLLVNDGSRDTSLAMIKEKCANSPAYDYISFDRN